MPRYLIDKEAICQETTCLSKVTVKDYCQKHYMLLVRNPACQCRIEGCTTRWVGKAKPFCKRHLQDKDAPVDKYHRVKTVRQPVTLKDLKDRTLPNEEGCWLWQGSLSRGYAQYDAYLGNVRFKSAHRLAYAIVKGIPENGMQIHHGCANSSCINPDHLSAVSMEANLAEMHERRRYTTIIIELTLENHKLRERVAHLESVVTTTVASQ